MKNSPIFFIIALTTIIANWDYAKHVAITVLLVVLFRLAQRIAKFAVKIFGNFRLKDVDTMDGIEFEKYVGKILTNNGYTNIRFTEQYDYGVDIITTKNGVRWGIQVKRYSGLVKVSAVRQVITALNIYGCERGMVITNSGFSNVAIKLGKSNDCILIGRTELAKMICKKRSHTF